MDNGKQVDPELVQFLQSEEQRQAFTSGVHQLNDLCWDTCMGDRLASKMDSKQQTCLSNCVNRFIDSSNFLVTRLKEMQSTGRLQ